MRPQAVDWYTSLFELIDMRSFSNLWYWLALAVSWSTASHWVLGVPYDMIQRARRDDPVALHDLEDMVRVSVRRILVISSISGLWILGFTCFALTTLGILAFFYWVELAQAVFLMAFPMAFVGASSLATAQGIYARETKGQPLVKTLLRQRLGIQILGVISIFVTAMFGMYQNLTVGALG